MRPLAAVLEPMVKQPVVIETKAGAAGQVGAQVAANAKPDGYTLLVAYHLDLRLRRGRPAVRPAAEVHQRRFHPDRALHRRSLVLVVNDQQPYKTLKEFVDDAKKRPNEIIFSSSGLYGALHLPTALFMQAAGSRSCGICRPTAADRR